MMGASALQNFYRSVHFVRRIGPGQFPSAEAMQAGHRLEAAQEMAVGLRWHDLRKRGSGCQGYGAGSACMPHSSNILPTFFQSSSKPKCLVTRFVIIKMALVVTRITSNISSSL
jgi:hypothetical protein